MTNTSSVRGCIVKLPPKAETATEAQLHDPLHAMQFRAPPPPQVRDRRPAQRPASSDRDCPLDTACDRCLWHVGGTAGENDGARTWPLWLQLYCWVRPVLADHRLVGKPRRRRGSRVFHSGL
jgi:hypothetical protein